MSWFFVWYACAASKYAGASFGFFWIRFRAFETEGPLELLLRPNSPPRASTTEPKPVDPEPTPATTKLNANASASRAKTHFVPLRMRWKKRVSSTGRLALRAAREGRGPRPAGGFGVAFLFAAALAIVSRPLRVPRPRRLRRSRAAGFSSPGCRGRLWRRRRR